jgi:hypothetical protein
MKIYSLFLTGAILLSAFQAPSAQAYDSEMCRYYLKRAATFMKIGKMSVASAEIKKAEQARCPTNVRFY